MENYNIAPVIRSGIKIIENSIEGVKIKILDNEMQKTLPTDKYPDGLPGVNIEINWEGVGSKKIFITSRFCESMHSNYGDEIAIEYVLPLFNKEIIDLKNE